MTGFCKKKNTVHLKQASLPIDRHLCLCSVFYETISDWLRGTILTAGSLWGALIGQCQEGCPDDRIQEKTFFWEQTGCQMSKFVSKINPNFVEFVEKLVSLDEKVIWNFLTLIAKNKLDKKGTLSLISNRVPFLMPELVWSWC